MVVNLGSGCEHFETGVDWAFIQARCLCEKKYNDIKNAMKVFDRK